MTVTQQLSRYKGILLDTNLMLLYCTGRSDPNLIPTFTKRLSRYSIEDYNLLIQFIALFKTVATTPNVLTETVNLIDRKSGRFDSVLRQLAVDSADFDEVTVPSSPLLSRYSDRFLKYGLTDLALYELAQRSYLVLTDDNDIRSLIAGSNGSALGFDELRALLIQKGPPGRRR